MEALETFFGCFQGFGREIDRGAVVRLKNEETDNHGAEGFRQELMIAGEELLQGDEVIIALAHLLAGDSNHVIVHPVMDGLVPERRAGLRYLRLVVGEDEVQSAAMDVELLAEVLGAHRRALHVPPGESFGPWAGPMHDMLGAGFLPEGEVIAVLLLGLSIQLACLGDDIVEVAAGELAIRKILGVLLHVHIDGAVGDIGIAAVEYLLHKSNLLDDMSRGVRFDRRGQDVERRHVAMVAVGVILDDLHRLQLLQPGFLSYLVLAFVGVVLEVTHIGDVTHVAHLVAEVHQIPVEYVERDCRAGVSQMGVTVHGRTADIHAYVSFVQRFEGFFVTR